MKNKYIKLFIVAIITMFISIVPTYAKEVSLDKKDNERDTFDFIIKRANSHANYVYLIGDYAFTSAYPIGLQDVMLAARSINANTTDKTNKDTEEFGKMTIYLFKPDFSSGTKKWSKTPEKVVGNTELPDKFNVKYIDYNYVKEDDKVDVDALVKTAMGKLSTTLFDKVDTVENDTVTINVKTEKLKQKITQGMASGVFPMLNNLLKENNGKIESIDFAYDGIKLTLEKELDINKLVEWLNENCQKIFGKDLNNVILADLLDKEFTATINLGESDTKSYVSKNNNTTKETYTIKFTGTREKIDTSKKIVEPALTKLNKSIFTTSNGNLDDGNIKVTINKNKLQEKIQKGMASGVIGLLQELVNEEDVESIEFVYNEKNTNLSYTLTKDFNLENMVNWFEQNCQTIFGYSADQALTVDLINKKFTAQINLKNYAQKEEKNPEKYTISFDGELPEVDSNDLLNKVMNKVNTSYFEKDNEKSKEQTIVVKVKSISKKIEQGMASGLYPALSEIANTEGIESIDFSYNNLSYKLTKDSKLEDMVQWFNNNKKTIFEKDTDITLADLDKKKFTVKVNVGRVGKLKDVSKDTYTIEMLKTHDVTFHDEKDSSNKKEIVTVYDGETIPPDEVTKRTKRDTSTEKFLGWYEEITEGTDKEEKFNFEETPITSDIELDAHWGTKLTKAESQKMKEESTTALNTINSHKDKYIEVKVNGYVIEVISHKTADSKVSLGLAGAGVKTALSNFLDPVKNPTVESITLSFTNNSDNYSADITKKDVDDYGDFVEKFDELFQKATGKDIYNFTWSDLNSYIDHVKVKVNLKDNKVFDEGNGEYTFTLEIQPTEGE